MRHVRIYGLYIRDQALYARYRAAMTPILHRFGGDFGYDLEVSHVFRTERSEPINRAFSMTFPDRAHADDFFADEAYLSVRAELFVRSVSAITVIATFDEDSH